MSVDDFGNEANKVKLVDGSYVDQEWVMEQVSKLKQMNLTEGAIKNAIGLTSKSQVGYYWRKVQEKMFNDRAKVPGNIVKGEILEILKTLRTEAFGMITTVNKKANPNLFISVLKTVKEMVGEEVKFMTAMKMLKPEEDKIRLTIENAEDWSMNELITKLEEAKLEIVNLADKYLEGDDAEDFDPYLENEKRLMVSHAAMLEKANMDSDLKDVDMKQLDMSKLDGEDELCMEDIFDVDKLETKKKEKDEVFGYDLDEEFSAVMEEDKAIRREEKNRKKVTKRINDLYLDSEQS